MKVVCSADLITELSSGVQRERERRERDGGMEGGGVLKPRRPGKRRPNTSRAEERRAYLHTLLHGPSAHFIPISELALF